VKSWKKAARKHLRKRPGISEALREMHIVYDPILQHAGKPKDTPEKLEALYNEWALKHLKKVGVEVVGRQYLKTDAGYEVAIFYKEVVL